MPEWLIHGFEVAGGILPAIGFGILLKLSLRDKRKTEKFGLERLDSSKKNLKKVLDKRFWF